jgi:hypothetical protein
MNAKAFSNNDVTLLVWSYDNPIEDCLGFCIKRMNVNTGEGSILNSMIGFTKKSVKKQEFKPTNVWPIQKFNWRDFMAKSGESYEYTIVPMIGEPDDLHEAEASMHLTTNVVTLSPGSGKIKAYFNRGILSAIYIQGIQRTVGILIIRFLLND